MISTPSLWKTVSNARLNLLSRSWIRKRAVVVEELQIRPGVVERVYEYPPRNGGTILPTRIGGRGHVTAGPAALPEIRSGERVAVELHPDALETIRRAFFVDTDLRRWESGGHLFGHERDGIVRITAATWDAAEQTETSVMLGAEPPDAIGCWHSHPNGSSLELSDTDWRAATDRVHAGLRTVTVVCGRNNGRVLARGYDLSQAGGRVVGRPLELLEGTERWQSRETDRKRQYITTPEGAMDNCTLARRGDQ